MIAAAGLIWAEWYVQESILKFFPKSVIFECLTIPLKVMKKTICHYSCVPNKLAYKLSCWNYVSILVGMTIYPCGKTSNLRQSLKIFVEILSGFTGFWASRRQFNNQSLWEKFKLETECNSSIQGEKDKNKKAFPNERLY